MAHFALYGNIGIIREQCPLCMSVALVIRGEFQCCDFKMQITPRRVVRIVEPEFVRRTPGAEDKRSILERQKQCCFYCDRRFGSAVLRKNNLRILKVCWDHQIPWVYSQNNSAQNFVAACQICNGFKGNRCFAGPDEARSFIEGRWRQKNIID